MTTRASTERRLRNVLPAFGIYSVVVYGSWAIMLLWSYERGGASLAGITLLAEMIPAAILAPPLSAIGDRLPKSTALLITYLAQAALLAAVAGLMFIHAAIPVVIVAAAVLNIVASLPEPIHLALLPQLAPTPTSLVRATSVSGFLDGVGLFLGPVLAGELTVDRSFELALVLFAVAMTVAAVFTSQVRVPRAVSPESDSGGLNDAMEGLRTVARDRPERTLMLLVVLASIVGGALEIIAAGFSIDVLQGNSGTTGILIGAVGVGAFLGSAAAGMVLRPKLTPQVAVGLVIAGVPLLVMALVAHLFVAVVLLAVSGCGVAVARIATITLTQRTTEPHLMTRVLAVHRAALLSGWAIGTALAPFLIAELGPARAYLPIGVGLILATALGWRTLRTVDLRASYRPDVIALLKKVPLFEAMRPLALDRLSQRAHWWDVPADVVVMKQGDYLDEMFVVESGSMSVLTEDSPSRTLGPGQWFEEAALYRTARRSATLITLEATRLLVIERSNFLSAVTGSPHGHALDGLLSEDDLEARVVAALTREPADAATLGDRLDAETNDLTGLLANMTRSGIIREDNGTYNVQFGVRHHMHTNIIDSALFDDE